MFFIWLYYKLILFLIIVPLVAGALVPFTVVIAMPRLRWVLFAGSLMLALRLSLDYLPIQMPQSLIWWALVKPPLIVIGPFVLVAIMTRLLTLELRQRGFGWRITEPIHAFAYLVPAYFYVSRFTSLI